MKTTSSIRMKPHNSSWRPVGEINQLIGKRIKVKQIPWDKMWQPETKVVYVAETKEQYEARKWIKKSKEFGYGLPNHPTV